jgi:hypothetical protein
LPESDIQDEYLNGQLCYVSKDYECAITKANSVLSASGGKAKPRIYKLLAYAYYDKADYSNALTNVNLYFEREKPEDIIPGDLELRANILGQTGGDSMVVFNAYMAAVNADTVLSSKIDRLKQLANTYKTKKQRLMEAMVVEKILEIKPNPTINDYFDVTVAYYFGKEYGKSREKALIMREKFTDQVFGYDWSANNSQILDTVRKDSIAVPDQLKLNEFSQKDTVKFKKQYVSSSRYLADYYINTAKDKEKALIYFRKWLYNDTANAVRIQEIIDQVEKMNINQGTRPAGTAPQKSGTTPAKTTGNKPSAVKPKATSTTTKAVVKK